MKNQLIKLFHSLATGRPRDETISHTSERGFMFIAIILILLVAFSFTMVSGAKKFEYSPEPPAKNALTPTATPSAGTSPNPDQSAGWTLIHTALTCTNGVASGAITTAGTANGYVVLEIQSTSGSYTFKSSDIAVAPAATLGLNLPANEGYATSSWRLNLFEGGTGSQDNFSGGTLRVTVDGSPTGCT